MRKAMEMMKHVNLPENFNKESILNLIPRRGLVGYATNDALSTYNFLSIPADEFNFIIKDFTPFS